MNNNKKEKTNKTSEPKTNKVNYTPYRKAYNKAKGVLVQNHKEEFMITLAKLLVA